MPRTSIRRLGPDQFEQSFSNTNGLLQVNEIPEIVAMPAARGPEAVLAES